MKIELWVILSWIGVIALIFLIALSIKVQKISREEAMKFLEKED